LQPLSFATTTPALRYQAEASFGIGITSASTGVIGEQFSMKCWEDGAAKLKKNLGKKNIIDVAKAIMTTDTFPKICSKQLSDITVTGIAYISLKNGIKYVIPQ
jgi:N-acetylglutamate synthase/N-acetylornithine aminotransferase